VFPFWFRGPFFLTPNHPKLLHIASFKMCPTLAGAGAWRCD
jgi:hypothetical protein